MKPNSGGDNLIIIFLGALSDNEKNLVNQLFKESNVKLYNISFKILRSHSDAEEAVSEAFLKIISHIEKIARLPGPQITPYCVVIVKNESANILRKRMRSIPIETLEENYGGNYSEIEDVWSQSIDRAQLLLAIDRLSDEEKYLVQLRYANDMSFKEIAVLLDINEETA